MALFDLIGRFVVFVFITFIVCIFGGYALSILWGWFIVPTFGAPTLNIAPAVGIALVVNFLTHPSPDKSKEEQDFNKWARKVAARGTLRPIVALCLGWVVHLFM